MREAFKKLVGAYLPGSACYQGRMQYAYNPVYALHAVPSSCLLRRWKDKLVMLTMALHSLECTTHCRKGGAGGWEKHRLALLYAQP